jgi:hypothetical protein
MKQSDDESKRGIRKTLRLKRGRKKVATQKEGNSKKHNKKRAIEITGRP